jgi:uncharacterized SAM-binding protein YcdF (DUF218 family)
MYQQLRSPWWVLWACSTAVLWSLWPWIRPALFPAAGRPWLVVLDGYHRLDHALTLQGQEPFRGWPILLITCPATGQPTALQRAQASPPLTVLLERPPLGGDTAGQAVALAKWLHQLPLQSRPGRVLVLSDQHHFPRAAWVAQLSAGGLGTVVQPWAVDDEDPRLSLDRWAWPQLGPALRDALRLQAWRISGSTLSELDSKKRQKKAQACWIPQPFPFASA